MNPKANIFLTGITGLLGSHLAKELLINGNKIFAIVRSDKNTSSWQRTIESLRFVFGDNWSNAFAEKGLRISDGDITLPELGIGHKFREEMIDEGIDYVFHCAASTNLMSDIAELRRVNCGGTRNLFEFLKVFQKKRQALKINHISTVFVAGDSSRLFDETNLDIGQKFNNFYEQSKFEAEQLVNGYIGKGYNISIFRPSMIAGDSANGKISKFFLFYQPLRYFANGIFETFPGNPNTRLNIVNVDVVASAILLLSAKKESAVYHLVNPESITVAALVNAAVDYFGFRKPDLIPINAFNLFELSSAQRALAKPFIPYLNSEFNINAEKTFKALHEMDFVIQRFTDIKLVTLFRYCESAGFVRRNSHIL